MCLYEFAALLQVTPSRGRRAISYLTLFEGFASSVFWPIAHLLNDAYGWRTTLVIFAALNLLLCAPLHWIGGSVWPGARARRKPLPLPRPLCKAGHRLRPEPARWPCCFLGRSWRRARSSLAPWPHIWCRSWRRRALPRQRRSGSHRSRAWPRCQVALGFDPGAQVAPDRCGTRFRRHYSAVVPHMDAWRCQLRGRTQLHLAVWHRQRAGDDHAWRRAARPVRGQRLRRSPWYSGNALPAFGGHRPAAFALLVERYGYCVAQATMLVARLCSLLGMELMAVWYRRRQPG